MKIDELTDKIVNFAQKINDKKFRPYQLSRSRDIVRSVVLNEGETFTSVWARRSGKSEMIKATALSLMALLPELSRSSAVKDFSTLDLFKDGFIVALAGPKLNTAKVPFTRLRRQTKKKNFINMLDELGLETIASNSELFELSNGSFARAFSGSEASDNEGEGAHLLLLDESQHLSPHSVYKILRPMVADNNGTISETGTPSVRRCPFYTEIQFNKRHAMHLHQEVPYTEVIKYVPAYKRYIEKEILRLPGGEENPNFRMNFLLEWLIEQSLFVANSEMFLNTPRVRRGEYMNEGLFGGIDWGKRISRTTASIIDFRNPILACIDLLEIPPGISYPDQLDYLEAFFKKYPMYRIHAEAVGSGDPMEEFIQQRLGKNKRGDWIVKPAHMNQYFKSNMFTRFQIEIDAKPARFQYFEDDSKESKTFCKQFLDAEQEFCGKLLVVHKPDEEGARDDFLYSTGLAVDAALSTPMVSGGSFNYQSTGVKRDVYTDMGDY